VLFPAAPAPPRRLKELDDGELKEVVGSLLGSFKSLAFYPDCTQALLVAGRLRASAMGPAENGLMADVEAAVRPAAAALGVGTLLAAVREAGNAGQLVITLALLSPVDVCIVVCLLRVLAVTYKLNHVHLLLRVLLQLRDHAPEGKLPWLDGGFKDWEHFHGTSFGSYNLWVARDELIPQVRGLGGGAVAAGR
jgi:hypothetical protein